MITRCASYVTGLTDWLGDVVLTDQYLGDSKTVSSPNLFVWPPGASV